MYRDLDHQIRIPSIHRPSDLTSILVHHHFLYLIMYMLMLCRVYEYTKESLWKFKDDLAAREEAERKAKAGGGDDFGGFGGFGGGGGDTGGQAPTEEGKKEEPPGETESSVDREERDQQDEEIDGKPKEDSFTLDDSSQELSPAEKRLNEEQQEWYVHE